MNGQENLGVGGVAGIPLAEINGIPTTPVLDRMLARMHTGKEGKVSILSGFRLLYCTAWTR